MKELGVNETVNQTMRQSINKVECKYNTKVCLQTYHAKLSRYDVNKKYRCKYHSTIKIFFRFSDSIE